MNESGSNDYYILTQHSSNESTSVHDWVQIPPGDHHHNDINNNHKIHQRASSFNTIAQQEQPQQVQSDHITRRSFDMSVLTNHGSYFAEFLQEQQQQQVPQEQQQQHLSNGNVGSGSNKPRSVSFDQSIPVEKVFASSRIGNGQAAENLSRQSDIQSHHAVTNSSWCQCTSKGAGSGNDGNDASSVHSDGSHTNNVVHNGPSLASGGSGHHSRSWHANNGVRICPEPNNNNSSCSLGESGTINQPGGEDIRGRIATVEIPKLSMMKETGGSGTAIASPSPRGKLTRGRRNSDGWHGFLHYDSHYHPLQNRHHSHDHLSSTTTRSIDGHPSNSITAKEMDNVAQLMMIHYDNRQQFASFLKHEILHGQTFSSFVKFGEIEEEEVELDDEINGLRHKQSSTSPIDWWKSMSLFGSNPSTNKTRPGERRRRSRRESHDSVSSHHLREGQQTNDVDDDHNRNKPSTAVPPPQQPQNSNLNEHDVDHTFPDDAHSDLGASIESESHGTSGGNHVKRKPKRFSASSIDSSMFPMCSFHQYRQQEFSLTAVICFHGVMTVFFTLVCIITLVLGTTDAQTRAATGTSDRHQKETNYFRFPLTAFFIFTSIIGWIMIACHALFRKEIIDGAPVNDNNDNNQLTKGILGDHHTAGDEEQGIASSTMAHHDNLSTTTPNHNHQLPRGIMTNFLIPTWLTYGDRFWILCKMICVLLYISYLTFQSQLVSDSEDQNGIVLNDDDHLIATPLYTVQHRIAEAMMILSFVLPSISYLIVRSLSIRFTCILWLIAIIFNMIMLIVYDLFRSWPIFILFFCFSLFLLLESYRQTWYGYIVTTKLQGLLIENSMIAEQMKSNEIKHSIGNIAHDLKTPLSGFVTGLEVMHSMAKDLKSSLQIACNIDSGKQKENQLFHAFHSEKIDKHVSRTASSILTASSSSESLVHSPSGKTLVPAATAMLTDANEKVDSMLQVIHHLSNDHAFMMMTINRSIDYQKTMHGLKLIAKPEAVSLEQMIRFPLECLQSKSSSSSAMMKRIQIEIVPAELSHCWMWTDKQWLQDNLLCLLDNAVKYSNPSNNVKPMTSSSVVAERSPSRKQHENHGKENNNKNNINTSNSSKNGHRIDSHRISFNYNQKTVLFRISLVSMDDLLDKDMMTKDQIVSVPSISTTFDNGVGAGVGGGKRANPTMLDPVAEVSYVTDASFISGHDKNDGSTVPQPVSNSDIGKEITSKPRASASTMSHDKVLHHSSASSFSSPPSTSPEKEMAEKRESNPALSRNGSKNMDPTPSISHQGAASPSIFLSQMKRESSSDLFKNARQLSSSSLQKQPTQDALSTTAGANASTTSSSAAAISGPSSNGSGITMIKFEIFNTGPALPKPSKESHSMTSIFHEPSQAARITGGTGLGLFTLANRVESLHGQYGVVSPLPVIPSSLQVTSNGHSNNSIIDNEGVTVRVGTDTSGRASGSGRSPGKSENDSIGACFWFALPLQLVEPPQTQSPLIRGRSFCTDISFSSPIDATRPSLVVSPSELTMKLSDVVNHQQQQKQSQRAPSQSLTQQFASISQPLQQQQSKKSLLMKQGMQQLEEADNENSDVSSRRQQQLQPPVRRRSSASNTSSRLAMVEQHAAVGGSFEELSPITAVTNGVSGVSSGKDGSGVTTNECSSSSGSGHAATKSSEGISLSDSPAYVSNSATRNIQVSHSGSTAASSFVMPFADPGPSVKRSKSGSTPFPSETKASTGGVVLDEKTVFGTTTAPNTSTGMSLPPLRSPTSMERTLIGNPPLSARGGMKGQGGSYQSDGNYRSPQINIDIGIASISTTQKESSTTQSTTDAGNNITTVVSTSTTTTNVQEILTSSSVADNGNQKANTTNILPGVKKPVSNGNAPSLTVLVVDDSTVILKMVSILLQRHGHKVFLAENGLEAVQFVQQVLTGNGPAGESGNTTEKVSDHSPMNSGGTSPGSNNIPSHLDVILMDFQMPIMNGIESIHHIRESEKDLPSLSHYGSHPPLKIIGFSAKSEPDEISQAYEAGMNAFLSKPFMINNFYEIYQAL